MKLMRNCNVMLTICACLPIMGIRNAHGQEFAPGSDQGAVIFGYTSIDYDPDTKVVTAYSETDTYDPYYYFVETQLTSSGCGGSKLSKTESTVAVQCSFNGSEGNTYTANGQHTVGFAIAAPTQGWDDPDNLSSWPEFDIFTLEEFPFTSIDGGGNIYSEPELVLGTTYDSANTTIPTACGDQRDTIIAEYESYGTSYYPPCGLFTQNTGDPVYTFSALNYGTYSWAILRSYFVGALNQLAALTPFTITSAYRNPAKESAIDTANGGYYYKDSRHQYGDAVDVASSSLTQWTAYQTDGHQIGACVEPLNAQGGSYSHTHLDWRTNPSAAPYVGQCAHGW